jgi:hypothetical protein
LSSSSSRTSFDFFALEVTFAFLEVDAGFEEAGRYEEV